MSEAFIKVNMILFDIPIKKNIPGNSTFSDLYIKVFLKNHL